MKKIICLFLAGIMLFSLAACGEKPQTNLHTDLDYEIGDTGGLVVPFANGEEISLFGPDQTNGKYGTYIFDRLSEITGAKIVLKLSPSSTFNDKLNVTLASGNLPDIFLGGVNNNADANKYATQGAFAAVSDYLDEMPNFKRIFKDNEENSWIFKSYVNSDGKLYVLPTYDIQREVNHGMLYRKDIFDKHGIKMWDSPESFYQALKKLKELYPDSYPLTSKTGIGIFKDYGVSWGGLDAFETTFDEKTKTYFYTGTSPQMKDMLDFFKKLYNEKLLDPEFLTNTQAAWTTRMLSNNSFVTFDWIGRLDQFSQQSKIEGYDLRYGNPVGPQQTYITLDKIGATGSTISKNKNAEISMKIMDFLYSPAGAELMTCGIKGDTFEINADGKAEYLEFDRSTSVTIDELKEKYGLWMVYQTVDRRCSYFSFTEREQEAQDRASSQNKWEPIDPEFPMEPQAEQEIQALYLTLSKKFQEFIFKYITDASYGEKEWNTWVKEADKLGAQKYVEMWNEQYKKSGL